MTRMTVEEAEAAGVGKTLLDLMLEGDELWWYISPQEDWEVLAGNTGIALVRNGEVIATGAERMG